MTERPFPDPLAHFAFEVANAPERHSEIVLAKELPVSQNTDPFWRIFRNIPSVETGPAHPTIAARDKSAVNAQVFGVIFDQDQSRPPVGKGHAGKDLGFMTFHVDGKKIDRMRCLCIKQNLVQSPRFDLDLARIARARDEEIRVQGRMRACHLQPGHSQPHGLSRIMRGRARDLVDQGASSFAQPRGKLWQRLNENSRPATLFETPGLRIAFGIVGTDLDKIP